MNVFRSRSAAAFLVGAFILTACSGGGGPASLPGAIAPSAASPTIASSQSVHNKHKRHPRVPSVCTTMPLNGLQVTTTSMTLAPNGSGQFTACTQYASTYKITVSPSGVLTTPTSPSNVTPTVQPTTIKTATITVTAAASACGNATITIKDKKGNKQMVNVEVTCSFSYTGAQQSFTVPPGVTQITVDAVGASGGAGCFKAAPGNAGGSGFELKATGINVTPGQMLYVYVGGSPVAGNLCDGTPSYSAAGFNGGGAAWNNASTGFATESAGGGGGASDVRTSTNDLTTRIIVAAGGGGGPAINDIGGPGGNGGNPDGAPGGYFFEDGTDPGSLLAGQGGTQDVSGGVGGQAPSFTGITSSCNGAQGSLGVGGSNTTCPTSGGGGGGYYGGGSGASYTGCCVNVGGGLAVFLGSGAGGGGSSFVVSGATVVTQQVAASGQCDANNNGCITISW